MIGFAGMVLASIASEVTILLYVMGLWKKQPSLRRYGDLGVKVICGLMTFASLYLIFLLVTHDFQNMYVASHTDANLSLVFILSAFWAGQEGSLLFWGWMTTIFTVIIVLRSEEDDKFKPYVASILTTVNLFFLITMIFASNPFARYSYRPSDGIGLNPLLQDLGMVIHPPTLFVGYAAIAIPFAYAMAGMITKDEGWLQHIREWTLVAWLFLSLGIGLGGWWSYHVLGWGGYWAWDPVENASLMPWLVITAFLHSVIIQEGKKGMKLWNVLLISFSFLLVIYATFLTRSGVIQSVHSFSESAVGLYFGVFLGLASLATLGLIIFRRDLLKSRNIFEAYLSKESSFLFNNLILTVLTLLILIGTTFPMLSEAVRGYQVRVGPGYFNETAWPLSMILIFLMGLCPLIAWRKASVASLRRNLRFPVAAALVSPAALFFLGVNKLGGVIVVSSVGFVLGSILQEFYRAMDPDEPMPVGRRLSRLTRAIRGNQRRYGGYIIHISMILLIAGIAGSTLYESNNMVTLGMGESFDMGSYTFKMTDIYGAEEAERHLYTTQVDVYRNGEKIHEAFPSIGYFYQADSTVRYPHIHPSGLTDLYLIYESSSEGRATFTFKIIPLVTLIWIGIIVGLVGGIVAAWPVKKTRIR
jgi:cytochrome c-type biogenesis protein CcmF